MFSRALLRAPLLARSYAAPAAPSSLDASLRTALKTAMKARDSTRVSIIKSALADLQTASHTPSPPAPTKTLLKSISSRIDAAATFREAGRTDLAEQYEAEAVVLKEFAPAEAETMAPEALDEVVKKVMAELGLSSVGKDMGRVIKRAAEVVAGAAGGKEISEAVRRWKA